MTIAFMTAAAQLSGKARQFGKGYRKLALVELEPGFNERPKMISDRAKGVKRVISEVTVFVGSSDRSHGRQIMNEMMAKADVNFG